MTTFLWITVITMNYVIISVVWFIMSLGRTNQPDKWFDYILCWPVLGIFTVFGSIATILGINK